MSTVKAVNFQHPSSSAVNLSLDSAGGVSGGLPSPNRNLLLNGSMAVHQRGTSTTGITAAGYYTADRWRYTRSSFGTWTQTVETDAPTGSGLRESLRMLCTSASSPLGSTAYGLIEQRLEGQDVQRIAKGTASAQQLTLSFWVKSNVTGTFIATLYDEDNNRSVSRAYTISASATWEKKTITFPADTTGVLDNDANSSLTVNFLLGAGSGLTSSALQTSWATYADASWAQGQVNLAAATNNYWQITGVQLEVGPIATPFEFKSFGQELRECQRYYWRSTAPAQFGVVLPGTVSTSSTAFNVFVNNPVPMRAAIAAVDYANIYIAQRTTTSADATVTSLSVSDGSTVVSGLVGGVASGLTANHAGSIRASVANGYVGVSAEL